MRLKMKVWVITHCAAEENGTPVVAGSKEKATSILKEIYDNLVNDFEDSIFSNELWDTKAEIIYKDDTYDVFEIFECEVE